MANFPLMKEGNRLSKPANGFPIFFQTKRRERIITADIWSFLRHHIQSTTLDKSAKADAEAFVDQAFDFYHAAGSARQSSKSLLYYYAFMNLAKVVGMINGNVLPSPLPPKLYHGISDPKIRNIPLPPGDQKVTIEGQSPGKDRIFPALTEVFRVVSTTPPSTVTVKDLLGEIPSIHRTYKTVFKLKTPLFCPIWKIELLQNHSQVWAQICLKRSDPDVQSTIKQIMKKGQFGGIFHQVRHKAEKNNDDFYYFESGFKKFKTKDIDQAIGRLATDLRSVGFWTIVTGGGYTHYLSIHGMWLPQLCSSFAVIYYLGSITRYVPFLHERFEQDYNWILNEFLSTQPIQMLHFIASHLAQTEVVSPYALHD